MEQPELAICSANAFRDAGIKLAIDDYGAGQSSIAYLKRLPADELKLDRSMISDVKPLMMHSRRSAAMRSKATSRGTLWQSTN